MLTRVVLVGGDLAALARVERVAQAAGVELISCRDPADAETQPDDLVLVDLDRIVPAAAAPLPGQVVGFYSHVAEDVAAAARAAGVTALPRGRFWRELPGLVEGLAARHLRDDLRPPPANS